MKPKSKRGRRHQPAMKRGEEKPDLSEDEGPLGLFDRSSGSEPESEIKERKMHSELATRQTKMIHLLQSLTIPLLHGDRCNIVCGGGDQGGVVGGGGGGVRRRSRETEEEALRREEECTTYHCLR